MAGTPQRVTEYPALSGGQLADEDVFLVVDVSDKALASSGSDKHVRKDELINGLVRPLVDDLSGVSDPAGARAALGLGTAATADSSAFAPAGEAQALVDDLSGVTDPAAARTALGLGTLATKSQVTTAELADGTVKAEDLDPTSILPVRDGQDTTVDTSGGTLKVQLNALIRPSAVWLASGVMLTTARMATTVALPACVYANGSAGVGATLTASANGALPVQDGVTPALGDRLWVPNQASTFQNGLYSLTQLGDAGTPWVLTRVPEMDEAADLRHGALIYLQEGITWRSAMISVAARVYVLGTTGIVQDPAPRRARVSPSDMLWGASRAKDQQASDCYTGADGDVATVTASAVAGTPFQAYMVGTVAKLTQVGAADAQRGVLALDTGTDPTGFCSLTLPGPSQSGLDPTRRYGTYFRWKTPTLSGGADTFTVRMGWLTAISLGTAPASGLYFESPASGGTVLAVAGHSGVLTIGPTLVASIALTDANWPTNDTLRWGCYVVKTAGTASRRVYVDIATVEQMDTRNLLQIVP